MAALSISTAWNETAVFVSRHAGPLFTVAFAFIALPNVAFQILAPESLAAGDASAAAILLPPVLVLIALSIIGTLAISALGLGRENVVGAAISLAFRRFLPLLGASLLVGAAGLLLMAIIFALAGVTPADVIAPSPASRGRGAIAFLIFLIPALFVWVRLMFMTPVAAAEPEGVLGIIRRSWRLTAGRFWKLLGFVLLFLLAGLVAMLVATMVTGIVITLIAGAPTPGSVSALLLALVSGLLNAVFIVFFTTMVARIYLQVADAKPAASAAAPGPTAD
jgi:hypothetical protein